MSSSKSPAQTAFSFKKPCGNCPFRKEGAIHLEPGRLQGIAQSLVADDHSTFPCHKTGLSKKGGHWDKAGVYRASGKGVGQVRGQLRQQVFEISMRLVSIELG